MPKTKNETIQKRIKDEQDKFLEVYKKSWTISGACHALNIHRDTVYDWLDKYPDFKVRLDSTKNEQKDFVESKLLGAIKRDNITAIIFWLKSRHEDYKEKHEVDVNGELRIDEKRVSQLSELLRYAKKEVAEQFIIVAKELIPDKRAGAKGNNL